MVMIRHPRRVVHALAHGRRVQGRWVRIGTGALGLAWVRHSWRADGGEVMLARAWERGPAIIVGRVLVSARSMLLRSRSGSRGGLGEGAAHG